MKRRLISTGSKFEEIAGYSRAVTQGDWCFVAGTTGYDDETMVVCELIKPEMKIEIEVTVFRDEHATADTDRS